jgi:hypothetical protein
MGLAASGSVSASVEGVVSGSARCVTPGSVSADEASSGSAQQGTPVDAMTIPQNVTQRFETWRRGSTEPCISVESLLGVSEKLTL